MKVRFVAASVRSKARTIRAKIYPGLFYGVEASDLTEREPAAVAASVIDVIAATSGNHDVDWFFGARSEGQDLGPVSQLLLRRGMELRRGICKRPHTEMSTEGALMMYVESAKRAGVGTEWFRDCGIPGGKQAYPEPALHPSKTNRLDGRQLLQRRVRWGC